VTAPECFELSDKVAVVTGGSRGIGRAIVQGFAEAGADVVIASRKLDACERAAAEVAQTTGRIALPVACHAGRWAECDALIEAVQERFGHIDVLVINAGMSPLYERLVQASEELYDKTLAVNLKRPFRLGVLATTRMAGVTAARSTSARSARCSRAPTSCRTRARTGLNALTVGLAEAFAPRCA
jgi:NAD(P)-dependent dehydrogenase (short-subunit alcohol dehydrogenase family)